MTTNFEPNECVNFTQSTKIGTHENKAIHSRVYWFDSRFSFFSLFVSCFYHKDPALSDPTIGPEDIIM